MVIQMQLDFGVVANPEKYSDLVIKKLYDDEVTLWVGKKRFPTQDPYNGIAVLICNPDLIQVRHILERLKKFKIRYNRTVYSHHLEVSRSQDLTQQLLH
jgi:hypothetical protein